MRLSGWGRFPREDCRVSAPRDEDEARARVLAGSAIARGNGRAYGDSAASRANTLDMRRLDHLLGFDAASGTVVAEAGVLLADLIDAFLPRGWFPPVTPGTKHVTLGGMIAADVHGKNHHRHGSFGNFVEWVDLMGPDGAVRRLSREREPELFDWTLGGMGLTGVILRAAFRLVPVESGWIRQRTIAAPGLAAAMAAFERTEAATYSVAWIDCLARGEALGRSLLMLGEHARREELPERARRAPFSIPRRRALAVPVDAPAALLNRHSLRAFNALYYRRGARAAGERLVDWDGYFYPLDRVRGWNRLYGRRGFAQLQCVLPLDAAGAGLRALLAEASAAGAGSFLAVLKRLGAGRGGYSFAMPGYTLALDFPLSRRAPALLERLDRIVIDHGGRFYLAKDARMSAETLRRSDPRTGDFVAMRHRAGRARAFASSQSARLGL